MTTTQKIVSDFKALFADNDTEISLAEMKVMLTDIYKASSSGKKTKSVKKDKSDATDKPKRQPTAYNLFMKEQMEKLKEDGSSLTGKEKMQKIAELWKEKKSTSSDEEVTVPPPVLDAVQEVKVPKKRGGKNPFNNDQLNAKKKIDAIMNL